MLKQRGDNSIFHIGSQGCFLENNNGMPMKKILNVKKRNQKRCVPLFRGRK